MITVLKMLTWVVVGLLSFVPLCFAQLNFAESELSFVESNTDAFVDIKTESPQSVRVKEALHTMMLKQHEKSWLMSDDADKHRMIKRDFLNKCQQCKT